MRISYHPNQAKVFNHKARFKVVNCGRRWGKTKGAIQWLTQKGITKPRTEQRPDALCWWVAPTYRQAKVAYRYFRWIFGRAGLIVKKNDSALWYELINETRIEFRSAQIPDNLRGEGVDFVVVDEAAQVPEIAWTEVLRSTLIDSKGHAVFISTPKGQNWFWTLWQKGQGVDTDYKSWSFSTYDNPFLDAKEIKSAEKDMPEMVARQEIWAEFIDTGGMVFRNVDACIGGALEEPRPGVLYSQGVDLAKYQDWTVIVTRAGSQVVHFDRFNKIDWAVQRPRIKLASQRYNNARVIIDSTGVGDPVYEALTYERVNVEAFQITGPSKKDLINNLILKFDNKEISVPKECTVLIAELKAYTYELTSAGRLKMQAPAGKHDDAVMACALAYWGAEYKPSQMQIENVNGRLVMRKVM